MTSYVNDLMTDILVMLTHARENGIAIPDDLAARINELLGDEEDSSAEVPPAKEDRALTPEEITGLIKKKIEEFDTREEVSSAAKKQSEEYTPPTDRSE